MAQPVWVLSVDLQTKTATFQSGMAEAAKSARGAFSDIQSGGSEMAASTGYSMSEARHGVMLLGEEFGIHLPRALTTFIAGLGPVGAAMEAAFPFLAVAVGATLLIEHLVKVREEAEKLTENQAKFLTATNNAFNALDQKLLQAGIKADELNKDHLGALKKQLELIDRQSMDELVHAFDTVSKAADAVFNELKSHWYTFGIGSAGAQHALTQFKTEYDSLLAQGKNTDASDLLAGTLKSAERVLELQKQAKGNQGGSTNNQAADQQSYNAYVAASNELKKSGVGWTDKEVQSQEALIDTLRAQVEVEGKVAELKKIESSNATRTTDNTMADEAYTQFKRQADAERKALEEEDRLREEARKTAIAGREEQARQEIDATERGTAARLAAIDNGIKMEERYGLQETAFYRGLLNQRIATIKEMDLEERKIREEAGRIAAEHDQKMAEMQLAADKEHAKLLSSTHQLTLDAQIAQDVAFADRDYQIKMAAFARDIAALDKHGKDYENKLKQLQNKESELTQQHENELTKIKEQAEIARNQKILQIGQQTFSQLNSALIDFVKTGQFNWSALGESAVSTFLNMALQYGESKLMMMAIDRVFGAQKATQNVGEAASAVAVGAATALGSVPWPLNIAAAAETEATGAAFIAQAGASFFGDGGIVPGVGNGDTVPAMLTPGEHVADKSLTSDLRGMAARFKDGGAGQTHHHYHTTITSLGSSEHLEKLIKRGVDKHVSTLVRKKGLGQI